MHFRSFGEIREVTEQMSKCHELCQILANDMEEEGIKVSKKAAWNNFVQSV